MPMAPTMASDMGVKIHPRQRLVAIAQAEITTEFLKLCEKHKLTRGEEVMILSEMMASSSQYVVRFERHGRYDKSGGIA